MKAKTWCVLGVSLAILGGASMQTAEAFSLGGLVNKASNKISRKVKKKTAPVDKVLDKVSVGTAVVGALSGGGSDAADGDVPETKATADMIETPWDSKEEVIPRATGNGIYDDVDPTRPTAWSTTPLDPLPPDEWPERPAWFDNRTDVLAMTNARLVAEYENFEAWRKHAKEAKIGWAEPDMHRHTELMKELSRRIEGIRRYADMADDGILEEMQRRVCDYGYQRGVSSNIKALYKHGLRLKIPESSLPGYHPERDPGDTNGEGNA